MIPVQIETSAVQGKIGPGSQPTEVDGSVLDILQLPDGMNTFQLQELPEVDQVRELTAARRTLQQLLNRLQSYCIENPPITIDVTYLAAKDKRFLDQVLGEGEVSIVYDYEFKAEIQESVLAGIWRIKQFDAEQNIDSDLIEVAPIPSLVRNFSFQQAKDEISVDKDSIPKDVLNAPPLIAEINEKIKQLLLQGDKGAPAHVINLSLLPQTERDIEFLSEHLGQGSTTILSRGYGNCRISSTATQKVWWVQYFNSQDSNILNSLEIVDIPNVACAAQEDIEDSAQRLAEILEAY